MSNNLENRLRCEKAVKLVTSAEAAAAYVKNGMAVAVSGFTPSGCPKAVPLAIAEQAKAGRKIKIDLYSGASVGPR